MQFTKWKKKTNVRNHLNSSFFTAVNRFGQLWDMTIAKLTLIDGENLWEVNLVFLLHVAVYRETVGGNVGGVRSLFTQVLWNRNNRVRPRSQTRTNKTQIPKLNIMAAFNSAGLLQRYACWISRFSLRTTIIFKRCETSTYLFKQCNEHEIILNVSESYRR